MINKVPHYDLIVAIDPDSERSGVAWLDLKNKQVIAESKQFADVVDYFSSIQKLPSIKIIIEAGYLIKNANWHCHKNTRISGRIGENTGRNHQTAILLVEMAKHYNLDVDAVRPLKKCWNGTNGKITAQELNNILKHGGMNTLKRTNQDARDAVLLALCYSKLPIKYVVN